MFSKPRKSLSLQYYEILNKRKVLSPTDMENYHILRKGYQGEVIFSTAIKKYLDKKHHTIYDLNLMVNGSAVQYDTLLLMGGKLLHFEIKYHSGDYYIKDDNWYHLRTEQQINHPIHQTNRASRLIRNFFHKQQIKIVVDSFTVFVHPNFHLYNAPIDRQIIFPGQVKQFLEKLNQKTSNIYNHTEVYKLLMASHIERLPHEVLPEYTYEELKKGIFCGNCNKELIYSKGKYVQCEFCKSITTVRDLILGQTFDFAKLFPNKKITVNNIYLWLNESISKEIIRNNLKQRLKFIANGKYSYYKI